MKKRMFSLFLIVMTMTTAWGQTWTINPTHYDANGDGQVTLEDVTAVANAVLGRVQRPLTSLTIHPANTMLVLGVGDMDTLTATPLPTDADLPYVAWTSTNSHVATVSQDGLVMAVALGECQVVCSAVDGSGVSDACMVIVSSHSCVNLGLPSGTLWATTNVGAMNPEDYGDYFAWGETETKTDFSWNTYKWCNGSYDTMTKYTSSGAELEPEDDAATVNWGSEWCIPSKAQIDELRSYTTKERTTVNGVYGYKLTSSVEGYVGKSIFLPATGGGEECTCWSRSLGNDINDSRAYVLHFGNGSTILDGLSRCNGYTIRPVRVNSK